jgi:hypothetical protein
MNITLSEARRFRHMNDEEVRCAHELCRHTNTSHDLYREVLLPDNTFADLMRCRRCLRWWGIGEHIPSPGNPALLPFRKPCKHYRCRTLPGTDDKNQCLECDTVFEKTDVAIAWKRVRTVSNIVSTNIHKQLLYMFYDNSGNCVIEPPNLIDYMK